MFPIRVMDFWKRNSSMKLNSFFMSSIACRSFVLNNVYMINNLNWYIYIYILLKQTLALLRVRHPACQKYSTIPTATYRSARALVIRKIVVLLH